MSNQPSTDPSTYLEQYKAYLGDLGNVGSRYATANGFYLSSITALLAVLALVKAGEALADFRPVLGVTVPVFGILLCVVWSGTLKFYNLLFLTKFTVLRELEAQGGLFPVFKRELELLQATKMPFLIRREKFVPLLFALPFVALLCCTLLRMFKVWA